MSNVYIRLLNVKQNGDSKQILLSLNDGRVIEIIAPDMVNKVCSEVYLAITINVTLEEVDRWLNLRGMVRRLEESNAPPDEYPKGFAIDSVEAAKSLTFTLPERNMIHKLSHKARGEIHVDPESHYIVQQLYDKTKSKEYRSIVGE